MTDIEPIWGDPPPREGRAQHGRFIDKMREQPGKWAEYPGPHSANTASAIRKTWGNEVDVETRPTGEKNKYRIWLRVREEPTLKSVSK